MHLKRVEIEEADDVLLGQRQRPGHDRPVR